MRSSVSDDWELRETDIAALQYIPDGGRSFFTFRRNSKEKIVRLEFYRIFYYRPGRHDLNRHRQLVPAATGTDRPT
jgi:hypothetical protein